MNKYDYEVHPMAKLFPMLPAEEYRKLKADIETHGLIEPIMLSKDGTTLLDGRNRLRACKELGISPRTTVLSDGAESDFIWARNVLRRHLTADQRAAIALKWSDAEKQAAADRQKASQAKPGEKVGTHKVRAKTPTPSKDRHATRKALAKKAHVSEHKMKQVAAVAKRAPELLAKVETGEVKLKDAAATVAPPVEAKTMNVSVETKVMKFEHDPAEFTPSSKVQATPTTAIVKAQPTFWNLIGEAKPSAQWDAWEQLCKEHWMDADAVLRLLTRARKAAKRKVKP